MKEIIRSQYRGIFFLALLFYLICAWFSSGYHHPDEHFQILEFANYKAGNSPAADLPWEFHEQIRPAILPVLAYFMIKFFHSTGVYNPFIIAFLLRLFAGIASWFVTCLLCLHLSKKMKHEEGRTLFILLSLFLWLIPYMDVRFSSENISGILFLCGVYLILKGEEQSTNSFIPYMLAGLLLGFSFFVRVHMVFAITGFGLWLVVIKKINWKQLLFLIMLALAAIGINIGIDSWFYGGPVLTPFNYFYANIIQNKAAAWGVYPWWYYFSEFIIKAIPPLSLFLLISFIAGIYKNLRNAFVWILIPFIFIHCIVGHKEMRFLFPVIFSFIYICALGLDHFLTKGWYLKIHKYVYLIALVITIPVLTYRLIAPAETAIKYYEFLYDFASESEATVISIRKDPYTLVGLKVNFYGHPGIKTVIVENSSEIENYLKENYLESALFLHEEFDFDMEISGYRKERIYCIVPSWVLKFNLNHWQNRTRIWSVYKFSRKD